MERGCDRAARAEITEHGADTLAALRKIKSEAKVSMRTPILLAELAVPATALAAVESAVVDVRGAGRVTGELVLVEASEGQGDPNVQGGLVVVRSELGEAEARKPRG